MVNQKIIFSDCIDGMKKMKSESVDIVITSPPYNIGIKYNTYKDDLERKDYLKWLNDVFNEIKRILKNDGSFFLNVGSSSVDPWIHVDVANVARNMFVLQNDISWIKSITINDKTTGHFKPINSHRFLNNTHESIFHFTKKGNVDINRKDIGVSYTDKSNVKRWKNVKNDLRCRGNSWFIPYKTIQSKKEKNNHPAIFPDELVKMCIKLHGYNEHTLICDPFSGIGTVLKNAKEMNINGIGFDIDKDYVNYTKEMLKNEIKHNIINDEYQQHLIF